MAIVDVTLVLWLTWLRPFCRCSCLGLEISVVASVNGFVVGGIPGNRVAGDDAVAQRQRAEVEDAATDACYCWRWCCYAPSACLRCRYRRRQGRWLLLETVLLLSVIVPTLPIPPPPKALLPETVLLLTAIVPKFKMPLLVLPQTVLLLSVIAPLLRTPPALPIEPSPFVIIRLAMAAPVTPVLMVNTEKDFDELPASDRHDVGQGSSAAGGRAGDGRICRDGQPATQLNGLWRREHCRSEGDVARAPVGGYRQSIAQAAICRARTVGRRARSVIGGRSHHDGGHSRDGHVLRAAEPARKVAVGRGTGLHDAIPCPGGTERCRRSPASKVRSHSCSSALRWSWSSHLP